MTCNITVVARYKDNVDRAFHYAGLAANAALGFVLDTLRAQEALDGVDYFEVFDSEHLAPILVADHLGRPAITEVA